MARVHGVSEKLQSPHYDAFVVPGATNGTPPKTFKDMMTDPRVLRFFVDIQNKTRLETNLQASGVLPSRNSFEARAMRVVVSTFCVPPKTLKHPEIRKAIINAASQYPVTDPDSTPANDTDKLTLINSIRTEIEKHVGPINISEYVKTAIISAVEEYKVTNHRYEDPEGYLVSQIQDAFEAGCESGNTFLSELIYNSVTSLLVGEKTMIEMPTYWFPAGAGVSPGGLGAGNLINLQSHGEPNHLNSFRFAEPVFIEAQQNFRVEIAFPQGVPPTVSAVKGPYRIWVVLDGYLTRDVQ
jgi:hypothetical protein